MKRVLLSFISAAICLFLFSACAGAYKGLDTSKGLDIYAWETNGNVCFGLTEGSTPTLTAEDIAALEPVASEEMKEIIASYNVPIENIFLYNYSKLSDLEICEQLGLI